MYDINLSENFKKKARKLVQKNSQLQVKISKTIDKLIIDPFQPSIKSHKVITKHGISAFSSRVTGDLRIIWDFNDTDIQILELLDIGGHSGGGSVYFHRA